MATYTKRRRIATHPRNPWEDNRLIKELQLMGVYGLRTKKELWTHLTMAKNDKKQAKTLLISNNKEEVITQGRALLNRLYKDGIISGVDFNDSEDILRCLKEVLNLDITHYLNRRLQYLVLKLGLAKDIVEARQLVVNRQIVVNRRVVDTPSMIVRSENEGHIEINPYSVKAGYKKGRATTTEDDPVEE